MLKRRATIATLWSAADLLLRQGLQLVVTVVLARLLTPEEFGTVALLSLFLGLAALLAEGGFSNALIQAQDASHLDESTVFWINLGLGLVGTLLLLATAPLIAWTFAKPILAPLTALLSVSVLFGALGAIQSTLLAKRLDFKTPLTVNAIAATGSGAVALFLAWRGLGIWALAAQAITASALTTMLLWWFSPWRPLRRFSRDSASRLFRFGSYLFLSGILDVGYTRLYTLLVGSLYSVRDLGLFTRAENTKQLPAALLSRMLARVAFPIFSTARGDRERLRRGLVLSVRLSMLINVPVMLWIAAIPETLLTTLFGSQWLSAAPYLRILAVAGLLWPLHVLNLSVLKAQGYSGLFFRLEVVKKSIGVAITVGSLYWGLVGLAWGQVVFAILAFHVNAHYTGKHLGYGAASQIRDVLPTFFCSGVVAILAWMLNDALSAPAPLRLLIVSVAAGTAFLVIVTVFRLGPAKESWALLRAGLHRADHPSAAPYR